MAYDLVPDTTSTALSEFRRRGKPSRHRTLGSPRQFWRGIGAVLGFATTAPSATGLPDYANCGAVRDPDYWGRGVGAALMSAARSRLSGWISKRGALGAGRQSPRRAFLSKRRLGAGRFAANRFEARHRDRRGRYRTPSPLPLQIHTHELIEPAFFDALVIAVHCMGDHVFRRSSAPIRSTACP